MIIFLTAEFTGYEYEPFAMKVDEKDQEKAVEIINDLKSELEEEDEKVTLDKIEKTLKENGINYSWVTCDYSIIRL